MRYKLFVKAYHGSTKIKCENIIFNGGKQIFFTTSKDRALSYGDTLLMNEDYIYFDNKKDLYRVKKQIENGFIDFKMDLIKDSFVLTLITKDEEIKYLMALKGWFDKFKI